jgi:sulfur-oxidizing protein SoxY
VNQIKRETLKTIGNLGVLALGLAAGLLKTTIAVAAEWNKAAFEGNKLAEVLKALGASTPVESKDIEIIAPEIAENGAVVPITINSKLPNTQNISLMVEKNPNLLSASFDIPDGTDPYVITRVKMAETSNVSVLVKAGGKYYIASKEIKVTLGGCGG